MSEIEPQTAAPTLAVTPVETKPLAISFVWVTGVSAVIVILALAVALKFFPTANVYEGIVAGWFLALANYVALIKLIHALTAQNPGTGKAKIAVLLALKLVLLMVFIAGAFWWIKVDVMAFATGYMCLISAALVLSFL